MGFLSSLFGKKSGDSAGSYRKAESAKDSAGAYAGTDAGDMAGNVRGSGWHDKVNESDPDDRDCWQNMETVRRRVERVMNEEWCSKDSSYEIRRELGLHDMGWQELEKVQLPDWRNKWAFHACGLFRSGQPVAMVLLLPNNSCYNRSDVVAFHRACEKRGIFCMNLIPRLPNRYTYIRERLRENVRL